jgi:hypothetical protein
MTRKSLLILCIGCLAVVGSARAKQFANSYCSFWVPDDWKCEEGDDTYLCRPGSDAAGGKEVVVIVTAKVPGPMDSFSEYIEHLQKDPDGKGPATVSKPPRMIRLGGKQWIDATHDGAEVPGYSTRYLATVDKNVAVLFTVSLYNKSARQFNDIVEQIAASVRAHTPPASR